MNELQPLLDLLPASAAKIAALWLAFEKVMKIVQPVIYGRLCGLIDKIAESSEIDDDAWISAIFASKTYRVIAYILDFAVRFKLPGKKELEESIQRHSKDNLK